MARGIVKGGLNDGGSNIKSIQRGNANLSANTLTITINSIDIDSSIVKVYTSNSANYSSAVPSNTQVSAKIVDSTHIQFEVGSYTSSSRPQVAYEVIEFNNVKSKQSGRLQCTASGSNGLEEFTQTIAATNASKSVLFFTFHTNSTGEYAERMNIMGYIIGNALFFDFVTTGVYVYYIEWQFIEFN